MITRTLAALLCAVPALASAQALQRITFEEAIRRAVMAHATTNIEVIDAQRRARDADTATAAAEDAVRQARLELLIATGRFPR